MFKATKLWGVNEIVDYGVGLKSCSNEFANEFTRAFKMCDWPEAFSFSITVLLWFRDDNCSGGFEDQGPNAFQDDEVG